VNPWLGALLGRGLPAAMEARWVVVDCETTGVDPDRDSLLSVAGVGVRGRRILTGDCFEATVRPPAASARENILVHGIGKERQAAGQVAADALAAFIAYAGDAPRVAFRAPFDRKVIARALRLAGERERGVWLDLADLLPVLFPRRGQASTTLDAWLSAFDVPHYLRHDALGDAYATAQLFQVALAEAVRQGFRTVRAVLRAGEAGKWTGA
jgi:DNA polymerase-3 subunit epsilon